MKKFLIPLVISALFVQGCVKPGKGNIQSITTSMVGIDISQDPANQTPHLRLGYARTQYHIVPTGTTNAPSVVSTMSVNASISKQVIDEDFATGSGTQDIATMPTAAKANSGSKAAKKP